MIPALPVSMLRYDTFRFVFARYLLLWVFTLTSLVAPECFAVEPIDSAGPSIQQDFLLLPNALSTWLDCEECTSKQLNAVVHIGPPAIPFLKLALNSGPSQVRLAQLQLHLRQQFTTLQKYRRTSHAESKISLNEKQYLESHTTNFINQYRTRSAVALGAIGGNMATAILQEAQQGKLTDVVQEAVQHALNATQKNEHSNQPSHQGN